MRHTWTTSPPLLNAECASPRETGLFPVHARCCPGGDVEGSRAARAVGHTVRTTTAHAIRLRGQDAGPCILRERRGSGGRSRRPSSRQTPPLPSTPPSEHSPSFTNPAARRGHQMHCLFWTFYYLRWIKASPSPDATPTVSIVYSSRHTLYNNSISFLKQAPFRLALCLFTNCLFSLNKNEH